MKIWCDLVITLPYLAVQFLRTKTFERVWALTISHWRLLIGWSLVTILLKRIFSLEEVLLWLIGKALEKKVKFWFVWVQTLPEAGFFNILINKWETIASLNKSIWTVVTVFSVGWTIAAYYVLFDISILEKNPQNNTALLSMEKQINYPQNLLHLIFQPVPGVLKKLDLLL